MRIQHNIMAMNAYRNYMNNTGALSKNLEKLSSGYKINRAGDDAAGLAISEKMRAQITGLDAAQKNVADGISLVQTAEGAMQEIQDMLNRMVYLATQSSNGTYDNEVDRENLQKEVDSLRDEINRIADSANFNGINLLDGSMDGTAKVAELTNMEIGGTGAGALPPVDTTGTAQVGTATITHNDALAGGGSEFSIELHSVAFSNQTGDKIEITIGDDTFTLEAEDDGTELTAAQIATSFKTGTGWKDEADAAMLDADGNITIKGQKFSVEDKGNGVLRFKQVKAPTGEPDYVDPSMSVNVTVTKADDGATQSLRRSTYAEGDNSSGTPGVYSYKIDTAFAAGDTLTINGKAITFGSGNSFDVDTATAATAADQAAAIKALFANDTTFDVTVDETDTDTLVFTQKTASTADASVLVEGEFVAAGSGSATGAMGSITTGATGAAGDKGKYSFTIGTNFADGDRFTLAGKTITMVSGAADASKGEVAIGSTEAESAKNIADYFNSEGVTDETMDITYSGSVLTATQKTAAASGATVLSAAPTLTVAPPDKPAFEEVTASGDSTAGEWKFDFSDVAFMAGDSITFGSTTINFTSSGGTSGNNIDLSSTTGAAAIAGAIEDALTTAGTGTYTYTDNADGTITIKQTTATDTSNVLDEDSFTTATSASATGAFTSFTEDQAASSGTQGTWTVTVGTNFVAGDTLTVKYGDTTKTLTFSSDGSGNTVAVGANETATAANIATALGSTFGDFTVSESSGTITLTQTVAGTGDGSTVEFTAGRASTGKGTFTQETAAVAPEGGGSGDGTTGTVTGTPASTTDTQITSDPTEDDTYKVTYNNTAIATAATNHGAASGDITIKSVAGTTAGTVKFQMLVGDTVIGESADIADSALTDGATFDIKEIAPAGGNSFRPFAVGDTLATVTYNDGTNDTTDNQAADFFTAPLDTGLDYTAPAGGDDDAPAAGDVIYDWNASTTNQVNVTAGGTDRLASTYFSLTSAMVKDTNSITIGDKTYTFTADKAKAAANSTTMVDISDLVDEDGNVDADGLAEAAKRLTAVATASNNSVYSVGYDGNRITVTEQNAHADLYATDKQKFDLRTKEGIEKSLGWTDNATAAAETGKGLTLQIGDTSDDFNQLTVNIEDMHTDALVHEFVDEDGNKTGEVMSIADIDISTQEGAAKAVDVIRNAINRVSMTRGTLGATQNRLEHTANNLSVMEENITNAESAIRDTDIAEEMMAYTKNNILIQSAQAMLAQANMVPQGVLQLLQ